MVSGTETANLFLFSLTSFFDEGRFQAEEKIGRSNLPTTMKYFFIMYKCFCLGLFLYQSGNCIYKYIYQETATLSQEEPQEDHEMPNICLAFPGYPYKCKQFRNLNCIFIADNSFLISSPTQNLTRDEYKNGRWRLTNNESELELYERIGDKLTDLLKEISLRKLLSSTGAYETMRISSNNIESKMRVERKDYYFNLKTYCLSLRYRLHKQGKPQKKCNKCYNWGGVPVTKCYIFKSCV